MYRHKKTHSEEEPDNVDRWLVSYADYMTLMFALFVVLYALAIIKEEKFNAIPEALEKVFKTAEQGQDLGGAGEDILLHQVFSEEVPLHGNSLLEEAGPEPVDGSTELSNLTKKQLGSPLATVQEELEDVLFELTEKGTARIERDENWVTVELSSGLIFASGSASSNSRMVAVLDLVRPVLKPLDNFIRVRGFTDNQPISNEQYASNWELSVLRATAIVKELENMEVNPARLAIEGYGQYSPTTDNATAEGRAQNRKVVIAISKYGLSSAKNTNTNKN